MKLWLLTATMFFASDPNGTSAEDGGPAPILLSPSTQPMASPYSVSQLRIIKPARMDPVESASLSIMRVPRIPSAQPSLLPRQSARRPIAARTASTSVHSLQPTSPLALSPNPAGTVGVAPADAASYAPCLCRGQGDGGTPAYVVPSATAYSAYAAPSVWPRPMAAVPGGSVGRDKGYTVGRGILGQPKLFVDGQPVRNALRYFTP